MKPIQITEAAHNKVMELFKKYLTENRSQTGKINFQADLSDMVTVEKVRPQILITPTAHAKMKALVQHCAVEIAWHGTVERVNSTTYRILDILCYPQKVSSVTAVSDDDLYPTWLNNLDDDTINALRFQGHSHVNMAVSPSGVDTNNWDEILQSLPTNAFYIFCICNKRDDFYWNIYDLEHNVLYENTDIDASIELPDGSTTKAWADAMSDLYLSKPATTISGKTTPPADIYPRSNYGYTAQSHLDERYGYGYGYGPFDVVEERTSYIRTKTKGKGGKR